MAEQAKGTKEHERSHEPATRPQARPTVSADGELSDADLDGIAGGFAPAPARKSGKPQMDYFLP